MAAKAILVLCAQALLVQTVFSQCPNRAAIDASGISSPFGRAGSFAPSFSSLSYDGLAYPGSASRLAYDGLYTPAMEFTATSGGALPVTSSSSFAPIGISVMSDNVYDGILNVAGELPFVGTTGVEGVLATSGAGAINHGCGNGLNAMSALSGTSTPASVASAGPAYDGLYTPASAYSTNAFTYDRLITPGFATPATSYNDAILGGRGLAYDGLNYGSAINGIEFTPTSGGALPVSSASAIPPTGIAVASDNAYEGALTAAGELPFVGTVAMEGVVPSAGAGAVNHACGNGRNAMISETTAFGNAGAYGSIGAINPAAGFGPAAFGAGFGSGLGLRSGFTSRGCGVY